MFAISVMKCRIKKILVAQEKMDSYPWTGGLVDRRCQQSCLPSGFPTGGGCNHVFCMEMSVA